MGESPNLRRFNPLRESQSCRRRRETPVCRFRLSPETGRVASRNLAPRHEVSGASTRAIQFNSQEYESENNKWDDCRVSILVRQAEDFVFHSLWGEIIDLIYIRAGHGCNENIHLGSELYCITTSAPR